MGAYRCRIVTLCSGHQIWADMHVCMSAKAWCPFNFINIIIMTPAPYCLQCPFPFKQMGACPNPNTSILYAYISLLPYLIPALYLLAAPITRRLSHFKIFILLSSAYVIGDKLLKKAFEDPRPQFSCKSTFGMPSSHMVVMVAYSFYQIRYSDAKIWERVIWLLLSIAQGFARIGLVYHTLAQVIGGTIFGIAYTVFFQLCWSQGEPFFQQLPIIRSIFSKQLAEKTTQKKEL